VLGPDRMLTLAVEKAVAASATAGKAPADAASAAMIHIFFIIFKLLFTVRLRGLRFAFQRLAPPEVPTPAHLRRPCP
jgi:hypothetical protein